MPAEATLADFAAALADPTRPVPTQTRGREAGPDIRRFGIYRNNVAAALIGALEARFPVSRRLVGDDFFRGMAGAFVAGNKPSSPVMIAYGDAFPGFVEGFAPARDLPYLGDVARLENAWVEAYHSAEATVLTLADLAALPPDNLGEARFRAHPSVRLLRSPHPAASIWAGHQGDGEPRGPAHWAAEDALIVRPDADVSLRILPPGGHDFAAALFAGQPLAQAAAPLAETGIDPGVHLVGLIEAGAFSCLI